MLAQRAIVLCKFFGLDTQSITALPTKPQRFGSWRNREDQD
jgi:hypothetical protein